MLHELRVVVAEELAEEVGAILVENGAGGVMEEPAGDGEAALSTYGEERALKALVRLLRGTLGESASLEVRPAPAAVSGWETAFLEHLEPVRLSRALRLVPLRPGEEPPAPRRGDLLLEPAVAFGFGEHPTTRLASRAIERYCRSTPPAAVLDVGTGTGVLALVAVRSGAGKATGVDIEGRAVEAARANARRNGMEKQCRFSRTPVGRVAGGFELVVANVDRNTLLRLAPAIVRRVKPRGALFLTGVLPSDRADLAARYGELGFAVSSSRREGEFVFLDLRRPTAEARAARGPRVRSPKARRTSRTPRSR